MSLAFTHVVLSVLLKKVTPCGVFYRDDDPYNSDNSDWHVTRVNTL